MVGCGADDVGGEEDGPGEEGLVAEAVGAEGLEGDYGEDEGDGEGFGAAEFEDLGGGVSQWVIEDGKGVVFTSGCAFMIACLLVLCGSSVYVQKNLS